MTEDVGGWLDIAARIRSEWGIALFVVVSYTFTTLFAISQVRAVRLDRQYANKREISRIRTRLMAFAIGAPCEFLIAYLWGIESDAAFAHAALAGALCPVAADIWIRVLYWRGCYGQAEIFKVAKKRRHSDRGDDTAEFNRL